MIFEYILTNIKISCPKCGNNMQVYCGVKNVYCGCGYKIVLPEYTATLHLSKPLVGSDINDK